MMTIDKQDLGQGLLKQPEGGTIQTLRFVRKHSGKKKLLLRYREIGLRSYPSSHYYPYNSTTPLRTLPFKCDFKETFRAWLSLATNGSRDLQECPFNVDPSLKGPPKDWIVKLITGNTEKSLHLLFKCQEKTQEQEEE
ncbi:hypothetical protein JD844_024489 [Phrynosoma platyrhinos]|uniref:Uncharacterized protein n=1 Tax=Phrynosoma platyrhinos TaxID=52577 RepID=A0ABQ7SYB5_PHRPL|nr:hypothetical protein JD844_024489 [Phrynosoma platyrhinos]